MALGELWWLSDLAGDCAVDSVYEMFGVSVPMMTRAACGQPRGNSLSASSQAVALAGPTRRKARRSRTRRVPRAVSMPLPGILAHQVSMKRPAPGDRP